MDQQKGQPLFSHLQYCTRCCIPETQEGVLFDEMGICQACQSSEQKIHINWIEREKKLRDILEEAKSKSGNNYDCIVPISGGKDSMYQLYVLTKLYGLKPLAVTFSLNWWSKTGWRNLQNTLEKLNVDHMMFTPNRELVNKLVKRSVEEIGDVSWHDHAGLGAFPLQIAVKYKIPLLIWGESIAEASGRATYEMPVHKFDREYFIKQSAKLRADQMIGGEISQKDLWPFTVPSKEEIDAVGVWGIHLGDYIFWDDERQMEYLRDVFGWRATEAEGTYKRYKSVDDIMYGMHDFTCYLKRGFGRATVHACVDVRNGLLTREEGFEIIRKYDTERPTALDYYLKITNSTEAEFYETMKRHRLPQLKDVELPITRRDRPNEEEILPHVLQLIRD